MGLRRQNLEKRKLFISRSFQTLKTHTEYDCTLRWSGNTASTFVCWPETETWTQISPLLCLKSSLLLGLLWRHSWAATQATSVLRLSVPLRTSMHLVLSAMGEQRRRTFLKYGVSNYFQYADLSGFLLIQTKSGGSRCSPIVSDLYSTQAGGSGKSWGLAGAGGICLPTWCLS